MRNRSHSAQDLGHALETSEQPMAMTSLSDDSHYTMEQHRVNKAMQQQENRSFSTRFLSWKQKGKAEVTPAKPTDGGSKPTATERWAHLRAAAHAVQNLVQVSNDVRLYGARHDDDETNWQEYITHSKEKPKWWIIMPDSRVRRPWELFVIILLLYVAVAIPVRVCFDVEVSEDLEAFDLFIDMCFILDVGINCISAYVDPSDGKIRYHQGEILRHYAQTWLFVDLLASIPVYQIVDNFSGVESQYNRLGRLARLPRLFRLAKLLRLLKLLRMFRLFRYVNMWQNQLNVNASLARLVKVTFGVSMVTHLIACLWYFCAWSGEEYLHPDSWVIRHGIQDTDVSTKYLTSIYWAFSTLTTVGFGDVSAFTNLERVFSIICMVLGVTWYAFIISTISNIINTFDRRNAMVRSKMDQIGEFMRMTKLPKLLRTRIRDYFHNLYSSSDEARGFNSEEIIQGLSTSLRTEVVLYMHRRIIPLIPFFKNKSPLVVSRIVRHLVPVRCGIGEFIVQEGAHADELYFLTKGRAVVIVGGKKFKGLVEGSLFGEIGCIFSATRNASVRAVTACELYALNKRNLVELMSEFPQLGDELRAIARARLDLIRKSQDEVSETPEAYKNIKLARVEDKKPKDIKALSPSSQDGSPARKHSSRTDSATLITSRMDTPVSSLPGSVESEDVPPLPSARSSMRQRRNSSITSLDTVLKISALEKAFDDLKSDTQDKQTQLMEAITSLTDAVNKMTRQQIHNDEA